MNPQDAVRKAHAENMEGRECHCDLCIGGACSDCGALAGEKCREGCQCGEAVGCETDEQLREMKADEEMGERYEDWKQGEIDAIRQDGLA